MKKDNKIRKNILGILIKEFTGLFRWLKQKGPLV
tara:strand:+ start:334 stop:435 length:102 start_codon:yes stop_codon:yes gene_type:complete